MSFSWKIERNTRTGLLRYSRRLGNEELGFYWESVFFGTSTTLQSFEVKVTGSDQALLDDENVTRTWLRLKNMFPLVACKVVEDAGVAASFVLDEERLRTIQPGEVEVYDIESDEDVEFFTERLLNGPPLDCSKMVSQVLVLRRRDKPGVCQIFLPVAHIVTDGMGSATLIRSFCNELCTPSIAPEEGMRPVEERLASLRPLEDLHPVLRFSPARVKWRWVVAKVIFRLRLQKLTGGHTLPCRLTPTYTPALTKTLSCTFPEDTTASILAGCRSINNTFVNALNVISQLAHARVIHRLHLQHTQNSSLEFGVTHEEWENRIRQPMHFGGPLNLRPFLSTTWYKEGGSTEVCLAIGIWDISLPSMPFCKRPVETWGDQFPSFDELMSRTGFKRRVDLAKRKMDRVIKSPLFLEISFLRTNLRVERNRKVTAVWKERQKNPEKDVPSEPLPPVVFASGGASLGNTRDLFIPDEYPLRAKEISDHLAPRLRIGRHSGLLRCRPAQLYLGALTHHKKLEYFVYYDGNVFDERIVRLWMEEAKAATLHYLTEETVKLESVSTCGLGPTKSRL